MTNCPKCGHEQDRPRDYCEAMDCGVIFATLTDEAQARKAAHGAEMRRKLKGQDEFLTRTVQRLHTESR